MKFWDAFPSKRESDSTRKMCKCYLFIGEIRKKGPASSPAPEGPKLRGRASSAPLPSPRGGRKSPRRQRGRKAREGGGGTSWQKSTHVQRYQTCTVKENHEKWMSAQQMGRTLGFAFQCLLEERWRRISRCWSPRSMTSSPIIPAHNGSHTGSFLP